jgi:predicted transcriptional regulator
MDSYFKQLKSQCKQWDIDLRTAFVLAGIPTSTFYRAQKRNDMRFETALKVLDAVNRIHASQATSQHRS